MSPKLVITIDTEPDNQWDLALRKKPQFRNICELPRLQRLFDRFRAKPAYLTSFSVAKSEAVSVLKDIAKSADCEIGSHLHAWETPPFDHPVRGDGSYLEQYSFAVQEQKLANLDGLITDNFGTKPVSYRGGRYSFDKDAVFLLSKYGYLVDTSVTPGISWKNTGGPDFKKHLCKTSFLKTENEPGILEAPVTIKIKSRMPGVSEFLYLNTPGCLHTQGILRRLAGFNIIWLDPSFNRYEDMKWVSDAFLREGTSYLNIMFHSSVIISGGSPYTMTKETTMRFFERLEKLLDYLVNVKKLEPLTLKGFYDYCTTSPHLAVLSEVTLMKGFL